MLRVRGDSMVEAGIFDGDYVVVRQQPEADNGDVVVAGIGEGEATVKTFSRKGGRVTLTPANAAYEPMVFDGGRRGDDLRQGRHGGAHAELTERPADRWPPEPLRRRQPASVASTA